MKDLIEQLKKSIEYCQDHEEMDSASWGFEEGVLMSGNDAKKLVNLYELCKQQHEALKGCASLLSVAHMDEGPTMEQANKALEQFNKLFQ